VFVKNRNQNCRNYNSDIIYYGHDGKPIPNYGGIANVCISGRDALRYISYKCPSCNHDKSLVNNIGNIVCQKCLKYYKPRICQYCSKQGDINDN
jgi:hypothetical protein